MKPTFWKSFSTLAASWLARTLRLFVIGRLRERQKGLKVLCNGSADAVRNDGILPTGILDFSFWVPYNLEFGTGERSGSLNIFV